LTFGLVAQQLVPQQHFSVPFKQLLPQLPQ
jgi:hypothetical protein